MQIERLTVTGLFGHLRHDVSLPTRPDDANPPAEPSVTIIHGRNGVGKTTLLRMLDGMMTLQFDPFREVPFERGELRFNTGDVLAVSKEQDEPNSPLRVTFRDLDVRLHGAHSGPLKDQDAAEVERFRETFFAATDSVKLQFIPAHRLHPSGDSGEDVVEFVELQTSGRIRRKRKTEPSRPLATRVERFIADAQVNYRRFFARTEPDLFPRIMDRLALHERPTYDVDDLRARLNQIAGQNKAANRFGLEAEPWDHGKLAGYLDDFSGSDRHDQGLTVLGSYTEFLETRAAERSLIAERLLRFEEILNEFLTGKRVEVAARGGFRILTQDGRELTENRLSSGEYHLLFLMVSALEARRRGTVIAIDEPEMSMHIAWQRKLVSNLVRCASNASPQFVFATHSPDVVADYRDSLIEVPESM
jgi:predicted ATPase